MTRRTFTRSRRGRVLAMLAVAALALSACGTTDPVSNAEQTRRGLAAITGLPQEGFTLGRSTAPWTLSIISSPTSYELDQLITLLPELTDRFVRGGRLKLQMRTPTKGAYGANGQERVAAGALLAAGLQDHYWNALVRFVSNYPGSVKTDRLTELLRASGVPDVDRAMRDRSNAQVRGALVRADVVGDEADGKGQLVYVLTSPSGTEVDLTRQADKGRLPDMIGRRLAAGS